jgi:hypothetical protein
MSWARSPFAPFLPTQNWVTESAPGVLTLSWLARLGKATMTCCPSANVRVPLRRLPVLDVELDLEVGCLRGGDDLVLRRCRDLHGGSRGGGIRARRALRELHRGKRRRRLRRRGRRRGRGWRGPGGRHGRGRRRRGRQVVVAPAARLQGERREHGGRGREKREEGGHSNEKQPVPCRFALGHGARSIVRTGAPCKAILRRDRDKKQRADGK